MIRLVLAIAAMGVGFVLLHDKLQHGDGGALPAQAQVSTPQVPEQFRSLLSHRVDPGALLGSRGALPGLGVIRRLVGSSAPASDQQQPAPFSDVGSRGQVREVERHIRRDIADLNRLVEARMPATPERAQRTLALVYSSATLNALGASGRRAFAERLAGMTQASQRIHVLDFDGVFVAGDRALAQVVYRLSVRSPSGRFVARAPATWTVTLAREAGRWRFVRGIDGS